MPWPALLPAAAALRVTLAAWSWAIEISCDLGSARTCGTQDMLDALRATGQASAAARAAQPHWKRYATSILTWISRPSHPSLPLRRAIAHTLAQPNATS